ncbi:MAG: alanine--tRNA ligase [Sphingobacteriaceae bacterium]|nr:alanine--tRNA ligase [Sphingobacteriaceae bacterium]
MEASKVRDTFLSFFKSKGHHIVPSAPMVVKGDPTLMFNNSGMAPFKDIFLGNSPIKYPRIADTQKCLRVSGKHNDLEEVGVDTYHHTMFEMLGNWSFGDYFKKEAISWAWELLTDVYKIDKSRLYVTVFEGSKEEGLAFDQEAYDTWKQFVSEDRILNGNKKDNFWEMGDMGPCGPCSEIHYDGRSEEERAKVNGATLVNSDNAQVIEIWNNVFMEFERKADGSLVKLPKQHVDTGMGFERLVRVLQKKQSNYDTDVFMPLINKIEELSGLRYKTENEEHHKKQRDINIAIRVIADHIRTISFSIADGQLPGNTGAGYVIRRILRRAIRYGYQSLNMKDPFMHRLVPTLAHQMGAAFPELNTQKLLIEKVLKEEEISFYKTLEYGLKRIDQVCIDANAAKTKVIDGKVVFELYDTFGFPVDLTSLIARAYDLSIDEASFNKHLQEQKDRSRAATSIDTDDWIYTEHGKTLQGEKETEFVGYEEFECETRVVRFRKVKAKNKELYNIVLSKTPFYSDANNHSATHLMHAALRKVLGTHVEQKGSLVNSDYLRFDFSHFSKVTDEEIAQIEKIVNSRIRKNIKKSIKFMPIDEAKKTGAMALFGEKYGDIVRVVTFGKHYSIELCGGTHVNATGQIGFFKITSEGAVAAGIRRIEAITSVKSESFINEQLHLIGELKSTLKGSKDVLKSVSGLMEENAELQKQLQGFVREKAQAIKNDLKSQIQNKNGVNFLAKQIVFDHAEEIKNILFEIKNEVENCFLVLGAEINGKPSLSVIVSDNLVKEKNLNAGTIVRELAKEINGGGGGQAFYAQAGGSKTEGLAAAIEKAKTLI